jgi:hypothetical protein
MTRLMSFLLPGMVMIIHGVLAGNAVKFSASLQEFNGEGVIYRRLVFNDNDRTVFYVPPNQWKADLAGNQLRLSVPGKKAEAQIESSALAKPAPLDEKAVDGLADQVVRTLPDGSTNAAIRKQELNALPFNGNPTVEVVVSYNYFGQPFQRAVVFVNTATNQIVFKFTAAKPDFDALYRPFRSSIGTWDWQADPKNKATTNAQ